MLHVAWFALITNMHAVANPTRKKAATTPLHVAGLHPSRRLHWLLVERLNKEVVNRIIKYDVDKYFSLSLTHGLARPVEYTPDDEPLPVTPQWIADSFKLGPWEPMWSVGRYRGTKQAYGFTG